MDGRVERFAAVLEQFGCATDCDPRDGAGLDETDPLPRWALMESDMGPADNGGPWWNLGDDLERLLHESANQERPDEWPAAMAVDLERGELIAVESSVTYHVPGAIREERGGQG